nr:SusF/SusE family outer membrane protein [Allomuricauda sp.]
MKFQFSIWAFLTVLLSLFVSCEEELNDPSFEQENILEMKVSDSVLVLQESQFDATLDLNWSTGTNNKTGAAIEYTLEMDRADGDFSAPIATFIKDEKNIFSYGIGYGDLNNMLLGQGFGPGEAYGLLFRVTAKVLDESVAAQYAYGSIEVTPYKPVSQELYIVGDATPNGWNIASAAQMESSTEQRGVFVYEGKLSPGNFKFAVSQEGCWCQDFYTRDPSDEGKMVYNEGGSGEDLQWSIEEELAPDENYRVTVDLIQLSITVEIVQAEMQDPPFDTLWIVGDASESGWDIDSPEAFVQDTGDPFVFTYEGLLDVGNFKVFAGPLGDWCGEWYRPFGDNQALVNGEVEQNSGCDVDNRWLVTEETKGWYKIEVNTKDNTIAFSPVSLYLIGDGGPNGWNINDPEPMEYMGGGLYVFTGPLGSDNPTGEFKISKFTGNWCDGDWINAATASQSIFDTDFIYTTGCDGPDNKWKLKEGEAGNYEIRVDLDAETITITAQ